MKKKDYWKHIFHGLYHYLLFFLLVAFVTTCCMALFVSTLTASMHITLTAENLNKAAKLTFGNVILLSILFTLIDSIRRKYTVQRPLKRIADAAEKIMQGDFSTRIQTQFSPMSDNSLGEISDYFNKMAQELQGVETLRTDFIANVSHEMKTPLAVIQNYGTLLQTSDLPEGKRMEYAKGVSNGARKLADMMTNILKLNRLENQKIFPQTTEYDLGEQLCECLLQYEDVWEREQIEIETDLKENVQIKGDAELLSLVWNNLFSNAFKFTESGGLVRVTLSTDETHAIVQVSDTGCGISTEVGSHMFEKFYQGDTSHSVQGNGLGLALVKRVVDIFHGEIQVDSTLDVGTTFTVKIGRL